MFTRRGLQGDLHWVLDLDVGGDVIHIAERPLTVIIDEREVEYHGGLEWSGDLEDALIPWSTEATDLSVDLTMHVWPWLDVPTMLSRKHGPLGWRATLYLYSEVDQRLETILPGKVDDINWGGEKAPIYITVSLEMADDLGVIVERRLRVLAATMPNRDTNFSREYYPLVFGSPCGDLTELAPQNMHPHGGTPVMICAAAGDVATMGLLAGHHTYAGTNGDTVLLKNYTQGEKEEFIAINGADAEGHPITYVRFDQALMTTWPWLTGEDIWCAWREDDDGLDVPTVTYGLLKEDDSEEPMLGVGDLLIYIAKRSKGIPWNFARLDGIRVRLNQYRFDGYYQPDPEGSDSPLAWISEYLLHDLPLSMHGTDGLYLRFWEYTADAGDAIAHLVNDDYQGRNCYLDEREEQTPLDDVLTDLTVRFFCQHHDDSYKLQLQLTGNPVNVSGTDLFQIGGAGFDKPFNLGQNGDTIIISDSLAPETYTVAVPGAQAEIITASELVLAINAGTSARWVGGPSALVEAQLSSDTEIRLTALSPGIEPAITITIAAALTTFAHDHIQDAAGNTNAFLWDSLDQVYADPWLTKSFTHHGVRPHKNLDLTLVEDRPTAERIAAAYAKAGGPRRVRLTGEVLQYPGGLLEPGSVVTVEDKAKGRSRQVGIVTRMGWTSRKTVAVEIEVAPWSQGQAV